MGQRGDEENFESVLESRLNLERWPALLGKPDPQVKYHFKNFGKTPAFVKYISTDIRSLPELPSRLSYTPNVPWNEEVVVPSGGRMPDGKDHQGEWLYFRHTLTGAVDVAAAKRIDDGDSLFWFYGCVVYEDVWGAEHVTRFCWGHNGRLAWFLPKGGNRYNERT